jgi:hypothetical protein
MSEWLKIMLEEIARKRLEADSQAAEQRRRDEEGSAPAPAPASTGPAG